MTDENLELEQTIGLAETEVVEKTAEDLQAEIDSWRDKAMRAAAELDNLRKRTQKDVEDAHKYSTGKFAQHLLPVADNFGRAFALLPEAMAEDIAPNVRAVIEGLKAVQNDLLQALEKNGVKKIVLEQGQMFDPNLHEVMFEVPNDNVPSGSVLQVVEEGYTIHERLLRPARVGVAKNAGAAEARLNVSA
jgi:molecular chaperone GrpE